MAKPKKTKVEVKDHQREHPTDPMFVPDLSKIPELEAEFSPESIGGDGLDYSAIFETICGVTDDSQAVESYDGTLGVSVAFVTQHQRTVGQLQWNNNLAARYTNPGNVNNVRWGTGAMISDDLFLTAGHCFDQTGGGWNRPRQNGTSNVISPQEVATNMHVNFNFQDDPSGNPRPEQSYAVLELVEYRLGSLDFAICRLDGNPGRTWGVAGLAPANAAVGEMICIIGHPAGRPKRIEAGPVTTVSGNSVRYNDIDTLGGNSGSCILRESDGCVIGVHTNGGCDRSGAGENRGVTIEAIRAASPVVQGIGAHNRATSVILDRLTRPGGGQAGDVPRINTSPIADRITLPALDARPTFVWADNRPTTPLADFRPTNAVADRRPTDAFADRRPTSPLADRVGTDPVGDVKAAGLDKLLSDRKLPGSDGVLTRRPAVVNPGLQPGLQPFVLATPHHILNAGEIDGQNVAADELEALALQYEQALEQGYAELQQLEVEYQQFLADAGFSDEYSG